MKPISQGYHISQNVVAKYLQEFDKFFSNQEKVERKLKESLEDHGDKRDDFKSGKSKQFKFGSKQTYFVAPLPYQHSGKLQSRLGHSNKASGPTPLPSSAIPKSPTDLPQLPCQQRPPPVITAKPSKSKSSSTQLGLPEGKNYESLKSHTSSTDSKMSSTSSQLSAQVVIYLSCHYPM